MDGGGRLLVGRLINCENTHSLAAAVVLELFASGRCDRSSRYLVNCGNSIELQVMSGEEVGSYKHDVAFSFLAKDVTLAARFSDDLVPLTSFVFIRKQEKLAGTDGLETFRAPFRFDSRLNVILLRDGWGQTPWTRVEEAAIQERCLNDGWNRLLVVKLDGSKPPKWLPETNLYLDLQTFPFEQAIGAIKRQAQQLGGDVKPQSATDLARARLREADFDRETSGVFRTPQGIQLADDAVRRIGAHLHAELEKISTEGSRGWKIASGWDNASYGVVRVQGCSALFNWERYANDCNKGALTVRVFAAPFETPDERRAGRQFMRFDKDERPKVERTFKVTRHPALGVAWTSGGKLVTSENVADEVLSRMIGVLTSDR